MQFYCGLKGNFFLEFLGQQNTRVDVLFLHTNIDSHTYENIEPIKNHGIIGRQSSHKTKQNTQPLCIEAGTPRERK